MRCIRSDSLAPLINPFEIRSKGLDQKACATGFTRVASLIDRSGSAAVSRPRAFLGPRDAQSRFPKTVENRETNDRVGQANANFAGNEGNFPVEEIKCVMKIFRTCVCMYVYTAYLFCRMC